MVTRMGRKTVRKMPRINPLPVPEFLLEAPGRSSDPSEVAVGAP